MDNPTFRLENVIKTNDELADFDGPLTLILQLLSKNKMEIRDISIAKILDQYLAYLDEMAEMDLEIASEFVTMASHLVYIKTKMLLSSDEDVSELEQLISSLEMLKKRDIYAQIKEMTPVISEMYTHGAALMVKPPEYIPVDTQYKYVHDKADILQAMLRVFNSRGNDKQAFAQSVLAFPKKIVYSIADKANALITRLKQFGTLRVSSLFTECADRSSLVASFIAILELCSAGSILLTGTDDDLNITYTGTDTDIAASDYDGV